MSNDNQVTSLNSKPHKDRDPLFFTILFTAIFLGILHLILYLAWGAGRIIGEVPWYVPMMHSFTGLAAFTVAFLAFGRYHVLRDPTAYWIGIGFIAFGMFSVFFILTWPNLMLGGKSVIATLPNTSTWIVWFQLYALIHSLFAAVLLKWPGKKTFKLWNWLWSLVGWVIIIILVAMLSIIFESSLPQLVGLQGNFTSLLLIGSWVYLLLFLSGAVLSVYRYLLTGDTLIGYVSLTQVTLFYLVLDVLIGGKRYDIWYYLSRILIAGGFLTMMFGLLAEYIQLFRREQEKSQQLVRALQARDEFISIASHELRTPITTLKLQAQIMQLEIRKKAPNLQNPERIGKYANQLDRQINRLIRLVDDMLDMARIQSGKISLKLEETELCSLVKDILERIGPQMIEAGTVPQLNCQNNVKGRWDRYRIEQVIVNLLINAMRYGNKKPVSIQVESQGTKALLRVTDQGRGIAKEDQARIFGRFERAVSKDEVSGLGVGLYISEQIIRLHRGRIRVESELGKGATFIVELPLAVQKDKKNG